MIRSKQVQQILQLIDNQQRQIVNKQNLFDNPIRIYLVIKSLYQNYKRKNVLQLMQQRTFDIKLPIIPKQKHKFNNVTACNIFQYHNLSQQDILLLIQMKQYLQEDVKVDLYGQIFNGIDRLTNVKQIMNCYRNLLNLEYYNKKRDIYLSIQQRMSHKLISMNLNNKDFKIISKYILSLPIIKQTILILISKLYQKVQDLNYFIDLFKIFQNNFPKIPNKIDLEALVRINIQSTLIEIRNLIQAKDSQSQLVLQIAEKQAKHKLLTMPLIMTNKTKQILNFIIQIVKLGRPIWHQIIQWQHKAAQQPKNVLKQNLQNILISMLKDSKHFETILSIIQKITQIDQHSQIGLIFVRQLLKLQDKQLLNHKIIRRFLAIKILKYNSSQQYVKQIFGKNNKFIDIILEMFNFDLVLVINFYLNLIKNQDNMKLLENYLKDLAQKIPTKFKQFYLKWNNIDKIQTIPINIANNVITTLLKILAEYVTFDIAISIVRDFALLIPSRHIFNIFNKFLIIYKDSKQINILKTQIARTLNIILIRTPKQQLNNNFKITLPNLIKQNLIYQSKIIFQNVSQQTTSNLKKFYQEYISRKKI